MTAIASKSLPLRRRRSLLLRRPEFVLIPLIFVAGVALWEGICRHFEVPVFVVPAPSDVLIALINGFKSDIYFNNAAVTLAEALAGFLIAAVVGIALGGLVAQFALLERVIYPYLVALQTLPKIAIAPLIVLWFGFGMSSKIVIAATVAFFPILVNVIAGLKSVDRNKIDLMRSLRATRWQIFWKIRLPHALPFLFAGLDIAIIFSILGAIVGEFVGSQAGLGNLIVQLNFALDVAGVFSALVFLAAMGIVLHLLMGWARRKFAFWAEVERVVGA